MAKYCVIMACCISLLSCSSRHGLAPVMSGFFSRPAVHIVRRGETLYSIAFRYDQDYRRLALLNHLRPPYIVHIGQSLRLTTARVMAYRPPTKPARVTPSRVYARAHWVWPTRGNIVATFAPDQGRKGIDIAGRQGQPILAAASGVVAYAGNGLAGFGNLIIIKHDKERLTAYAYNARNVVHEGQHVVAGQKIAEMGQVGRRYWGLHFEVRETGHPVNPLRYVQNR